jgi:predicted alpha/beta-hydrolase family hydrolase
MKAEAKPVTIAVGEGTVSGLVLKPAKPIALYVLAHGAGAGMAHPFLAQLSAALAERHVATLRYQFPYMERGSRRPDSPGAAQATAAAAVAAAGQLSRGLPLFAGGKSFGGRMTSQAAAHGLIPMVKGLIFLGFPLHPPGAPADMRGDHLADVKIPMLFLQGTRDEFADLAFLKPLISRLGKRATLHLVEGGDHSFKLPASLGRKPAEVMAELADTAAAFMAANS